MDYETGYSDGYRNGYLSAIEKCAKVCDDNPRVETGYAFARLLRKLVALVPALFLCGCLQPQVLAFKYHGSTKGRMWATNAASEWNRTCGTSISVGDWGIPLYEVHGTIEGVPNVYGRTYKFDEEVKSVWFSDLPYGERSIKHEFGHALGLPHRPYGIMQTEGHAWAIEPSDCP